MKEKCKLFLKLFLTCMYISAFTFGGGFVIVNFMRRKFVEELHWIDEQEMLDITALAQSAPGAIAVNAAILVGFKVQGIAGVFAAVIGTVLPPFLILTVISFFYRAFAENPYVAVTLQGMQAGVAAVILDVACSLGSTVLREKQWLNFVLMGGGFAATFFLKWNVVYILLGALAVGVCRELYRLKGRCAK